MIRIYIYISICESKQYIKENLATLTDRYENHFKQSLTSDSHRRLAEGSVNTGVEIGGNCRGTSSKFLHCRDSKLSPPGAEVCEGFLNPLSVYSSSRLGTVSFVWCRGSRGLSGSARPCRRECWIGSEQSQQQAVRKELWITLASPRHVTEPAVTLCLWWCCAELLVAHVPRLCCAVRQVRRALIAALGHVPVFVQCFRCFFLTHLIQCNAIWCICTLVHGWCYKSFVVHLYTRCATRAGINLCCATSTVLVGGVCSAVTCNCRCSALLWSCSCAGAVSICQCSCNATGALWDKVRA